MAISSGNVTPGASAPLCTIPPGPCTVLISNTSGVTVYVTAGVAATAANGFAIPTTAPPVEIPTYAGSRAVPLNVFTAGSPTGVVSWMISTSQ